MVEDILWLKISVNDLALMHVIKSLEGIFENNLGEILIKFFFLPQKAIQLPTGAQLHHQTNMPLVTEERIELDNVGMV